MARHSDDIDDLIAGLSDDEKKSDKRDDLPTLNQGEYNPREALASTLYIFVENQLQAIQEQEKFRNVVVDELIDRVKEQQVKVPDLLRLYEIISKQKRDSTTSILNLFKSNQGSGAAIFDADEGSESSEKEYETLTTSERVAIEKLSRILSSSKLRGD